MFAVFRAELSKQFRRPRTFVALGVMAAIPVIIAIVLKINPPSSPAGEGGGGLFFFGSLSSGLLLPVAALRLMSRFMLVIVVALFAGDAIASEASWGNLRSLLTRPVSRGRLIGAKLMLSVLLGVVAVVTVAVTGLIAGVIAFGWHPISLGFFGISQSQGQLLGNLGLASLYIAWSLTTVVAVSFMVSTMTDAPAGAMLAGVGFYFVSQILDAIDSLGSVRYVLPTHYFDNWTDLFSKSGASTDMARGALLQIGYVLLFSSVAFWWFRRKDVLS
jgi:ABC-2 type transport system permease protein